MSTALIHKFSGNFISEYKTERSFCLNATSSAFMFNTERRQYILERLQQYGRVVATELSADLEVSEDTIRRDLREMASEGMIQRVHGGALLKSPAATNYTNRQSQAPDAKRDIAKVAAGLAQNGQVIILDGGTTTLLVAQHFPLDLRATVITNSPPAAMALQHHPQIETILIGGTFSQELQVTSGAATVEGFRRIRADLCMLGICSLHPEVGISTPYLEEAYIKQIMIENSAEVAALASPEKLGTAAPYVIAPLKELTYLVTEHDVPDKYIQPYKDLGITVLHG